MHARVRRLICAVAELPNSGDFWKYERARLLQKLSRGRSLSVPESRLLALYEAQHAGASEYDLAWLLLRVARAILREYERATRRRSSQQRTVR
jgi:hypothetical protein